MEQLSNKNPRIEVVDALRGFAVMAILLVHSLEHFIFPIYPTDSPTWLNIGSGSIKRCFYPICRKILRNLRSPVRIYILHSEQ